MSSKRKKVSDKKKLLQSVSSPMLVTFNTGSSVLFMPAAKHMGVVGSVGDAFLKADAGKNKITTYSGFNDTNSVIKVMLDEAIPEIEFDEEDKPLTLSEKQEKGLYDLVLGFVSRNLHIAGWPPVVRSLRPDIVKLHPDLEELANTMGEET